MDLFELSAKIELNTDNYEESVKDATDKAEDLENALDGASESLNETEDAAEDTSKAFDNAGKKIDDTADAAKDAEKAVDDLGKTTKETSQETEGLGKSTEKSKESMVDSIIKADLFTSALKKAGEMALELAKYIWNLDEATEEYRVAQTKLNTAFKISGFGANTARDAYKGLYRAVGDVDRATEASQLLSQLARDTQDVADWTEIATGVVGTFGDSLPIEALIEAANETSRTGKVVGVLADALNWAGNVGEEDFNSMLAECETQEERVELITRTLLGTYSAAAKTFQETSSSVMEARDAFLQISDAQAKAGKSVEQLKNTLTVSGSLAASGFFSWASQIVDDLNGIAGSSKSATRYYVDFINSAKNTLQTGSAEEIEALNKRLENMSSLLDTVTGRILVVRQLGGSWFDVFSTIGLKGEVDNLLLADDAISSISESATGAAAAETEAAEAANAMEEAMEPVIATAGGLSVQLEGTGLTAEEASGRLKTYTDAALNMFGQISTESEISYKDAVANLEANVKATEDFAANMRDLAGALPPSLAEMFNAGGPQLYAGTVAMLADANRGADVGLKELNNLWSDGGTAAVDAFLQSLGTVPSDVETPATIVAEQIEADESMEIATTNAVERTKEAMENAVVSAGFDNIGSKSIEKYINGMEKKHSQAKSKAQTIASDAANAMNTSAYSAGSHLISTFISGMESMRSSARAKGSSIAGSAISAMNSGSRGSGRAGGLDIVPYNGYPATLHAGEAVLTAREAKEWRSGNAANNKLSLGGVNINVYGAEHQDERAIAEAIADQLQKLVNRKEAVFGNA